MPIHGLSPSQKPVKPPHFDIEQVIRPNILDLHLHCCTQDDYKEGILLDANENALGHSISEQDAPNDDPTLDLDLHRYPDPSHDPIKAQIAALHLVSSVDYIFLGVGLDEVINLLMRVCGKGEDIDYAPDIWNVCSLCASEQC
ncbi:hypothetical protein GYMLUDRAFT_1021677 [Collybiopsis luxurians FD-317 M1]|uniref:Uncharacterized protein n=1 Tax=Collybiopsis luxurians FD-317 M1 TaxID=944289 RepID=A0A0D0BK44_9AGAR|nr:hypothetical protein GYMLUDRAFT_1021677 [Collybiopsis luxurians FD-317 M1]